MTDQRSNILLRLTAPWSTSINPNELRLCQATADDVIDWFNLLSRADQQTFTHRLLKAAYVAKVDDLAVRIEVGIQTAPFDRAAVFLPVDTIVQADEFHYRIIEGNRATTIRAHDVVDVQLPDGAIRLDQVVYGIEAAELNGKIAQRLGIVLPFGNGTRTTVGLDTVKINPNTIRPRP